MNYFKYVFWFVFDFNIMFNCILQFKNVCVWVGDINVVRDEELEFWMSQGRDD